MDQEINDRGIAIDLTVVENAIAFDEKTKASLMSAMQDITNLDNPNSVAQMKQWLSENGIVAESLGKKDVAGLIKETDGDITEALKLRLQLAKSSVKKYQQCRMQYVKTIELTACFHFTEPQIRTLGMSIDTVAESSSESHVRFSRSSCAGSFRRLRYALFTL